MSEISTFAPTAANLWAVAQSFGIDPGPLFEEENIEISFPIDANARISYHKFDRVRARVAAAALTKMMRYNYGPHLNPSFLSLKRPTPVDTTPWDSYFGCEIEYGAKRNEIHVPLDILDVLLPSANPHLAKLNEELVIQYLELLDREDFTGRVHAEISFMLGFSEASSFTRAFRNWNGCSPTEAREVSQTRI